MKPPATRGPDAPTQRARAAVRPQTAGILQAAAWATPGPRPLREGKARFRSERRAPPPNIERSYGDWDKQNDPRNCSMSFTFRDGPGG